VSPSATVIPIAPAPAPAGIDWRAELDKAVVANPRGAAGVAESLGVSRGYVSQVLNGHWPVVPAQFVVRVVERLCSTACPYLRTDIPHAACREYAAREWRAISQFEVDHWRACKTCTCRAPDPLPTPLKPKPANWVFVPRPRPAKPRRRSAVHTPAAPSAAVQGATT
jgi:DNA-binding transcriptional regulator YdaS (Cro superfamily)